MQTTPPVRQPRRLGTRGQRWLDGVLVAALLLPLPIVAWTGDWAYLVLATAQAVPLLWRRSHAVPAFAVVAVASAAQLPLLATPIHTQLAFPVGVYSVARYAGPRAAASALAVGLVASVLGSIDWLRGFDIEIAASSLLPYAVSCAAFVVSAWALGTLGRTRRAYVDALLERQARLEFAARQQTEIAAAAERARIAREMHDVVAHSLTTIVVQADGARYAAARDPSNAVDSLARVSVTARESLAQMRRLLGVLRSDATGTAPQPRLPDLADLATASVTPQLSGLDRPVADDVALTAYRVAQEALTNVRKHAGPDASAVLRVVVGDDDVLVEVSDDGRGAAAADDGAGLGLLGMRERVAAHDGDLETGPRPGGGFRVRMRIPR